MKAMVSLAASDYSDPDEILKLTKLGFKFTKYGWLKDDPYQVEIEINSLDDLTNFIREHGSVVLDYRDTNSLDILIYNGYIE